MKNKLKIILEKIQFFHEKRCMKIFNFVTYKFECNSYIIDIHPCKKISLDNDRYLLSSFVFLIEARNCMPPGTRVKSIYVFKLKSILKLNIMQNEL